MALLSTLLKSATRSTNLNEKFYKSFQISIFRIAAQGPQQEAFRSRCLRRTCPAASQHTCRRCYRYRQRSCRQIPPCCARAFIHSPALLGSFTNANLLVKCFEAEHTFSETVCIFCCTLKSSICGKLKTSPFLWDDSTFSPATIQLITFYQLLLFCWIKIYLSQLYKSCNCDLSNLLFRYKPPAWTSAGNSSQSSPRKPASKWNLVLGRSQTCNFSFWGRVSFLHISTLPPPEQGWTGWHRCSDTAPCSCGCTPVSALSLLSLSVNNNMRIACLL